MAESASDIAHLRRLDLELLGMGWDGVEIHLESQGLRLRCFRYDTPDDARAWLAHLAWELLLDQPQQAVDRVLAAARERLEKLL